MKTLIHITEDEVSEKKVGIKVEVNLPFNNTPYCMEVLNLLGNLKNDILKKTTETCEENITKKKTILEKAREIFTGKIPEEEERKIQEKLKNIENIEKQGKILQSTLLNFKKALDKATPEDRNIMIKDVDTFITTITKGG